jgi:hypothetical protein
MKILVALVGLPLLFLAALGLAAYQMVATIPPWLLVVVIVYLLCRRRRPSRARPVPAHLARPATPPPWTTPAAQPALPPPPPVLVVLMQASEPAPPRLTSAPEPWLLT